MRYPQDSNASSLTIETQPQPAPSLIFPAPLLNNTTGYSPDTSTFYPPASQIFSGLADVRPRLGSSSTPSSGMAQAHHRSTALPNPVYNARELYSRSTPSFPRGNEYTTTQRSPPFTSLSRRHPLSPTPSPSIGFTNPIRMDPSQYGAKAAQNIPPLQSITPHGHLMYAQGQTPIKVDIHGTIDKGFFLSEGDWTCYRRNYFSCVCSYSLQPNYNGAAMHYTPNGSTTTYNVFGFAMSLSAVVADSDSHAIDLVQHTPKRDKGPTSRPERVQMSPKQPQQAAHPLGTLAGYPDHTQQYPPQGGYPTEHTFERIQFKQATANNGKRRAAQQYYHLLVELYAHVAEVGTGRNTADQWMKIAHRKSAKMIVRGRSPGHYQTERRGSTSSGPGGSSGTFGGYGSQVPDYSTGGSSLLGGSYTSSQYDHRTNHYSQQRHHDLPMEPIMSPEEVKTIDSTKDYQYYPTTIYEGTDVRQGVEMFVHRNGHESIMTSMPGNAESRVKHESESTLPSLFGYQGQAYYSRGCGRFEGKTSSAGYYPTMLPQSS
ncbi:uncharacterized protein BCR38DRAFT_220216 [Pseudomassariella vexata]|uniref:NDT80 domain-containing protein n=1 Tax=Pseudomassariella vexata TaxID=1141098 RepID=A0A1Y2DWQ6_9PEZI|nr:uncharacterized protein BCR38DRAFT_220216 [Pseudomassariella vexata]ORY63055.1 hypothetical protein BCR38DRAFT_220216 [Pseudomassariella vexata]